MKLAYYIVAVIHAVGVLLLLLFSVWIWLNPGYSRHFLISLLSLFATWPVFKGCPLTKLENFFRRKVRQELTYREQCVVFYGRKMGVDIPRRAPLAIMVGMIVNAILSYIRYVSR